jgi:hypothetical protein
MSEDALLTGKLEPTNEPYAIAKIAGIKMCESYNRQYGTSHGIDCRSVMPANLYGPGDNYHPENSHVISALLRRFHEAKVSNAPKVVIWGTGAPISPKKSGNIGYRDLWRSFSGDINCFCKATIVEITAILFFIELLDRNVLNGNIVKNKLLI